MKKKSRNVCGECLTLSHDSARRQLMKTSKDDLLPVSKGVSSADQAEALRHAFEQGLTESPMTVKTLPPSASQLVHLKPQNAMGAIFVTACAGLTGLSLWLSTLDNLVAWLSGQILLAVALIQWFVLLHETGHQTLFRTRFLNTYVGHLASFFSIIPFHCWKVVHNKHHVWTGWQDLDATTATLVPRKLGGAEKVLVNFCWKIGRA